MPTIVFETHATTTDNEAGIATGWLPGELSAQGHRQAAELGERRRDDGIIKVFTSDLRRAVQTAEIAFAGSRISVYQDERLRECDYGTWTGRPAPELAAVRSEHVDEPWPGGQSYRQVVEHTRDFLRHRAHDTGRILVVAHSATRWALQHLLEGTPLKDLIDAPFDWRPGWTFNLPTGWGDRPSPHDDAEFRVRVAELASRIVAGTAFPYWAGLDIMGLGMSLGSDLAMRVSLVWAALTDIVELRPQEQAQAEEQMRAAAAEWLAIAGDTVAESIYLDRWTYDILGYQRG
ncbi:histidine phosphatase family protein [Nonomuraea sp. 3N208]|uniref:histidine phosphatase family protein n=1 Tax=Nonomuraea sp. 3N208 TaxID=3457421 RepID=UPI003FCE7A92